MVIGRNKIFVYIRRTEKNEQWDWAPVIFNYEFKFFIDFLPVSFLLFLCHFTILLWILWLKLRVHVNVLSDVDFTSTVRLTGLIPKSDFFVFLYICDKSCAFNHQQGLFWVIKKSDHWSKNDSVKTGLKTNSQEKNKS